MTAIQVEYLGEKYDSIAHLATTYGLNESRLSNKARINFVLFLLKR